VVGALACLGAGMAACGDDTLQPLPVDAAVDHTIVFEAAVPTDGNQGTLPDGASDASDTGTDADAGADAGSGADTAADADADATE
jgi:hypothetical protein